MTSALVILVLGGWAAIFLWRVRVEKGWVGVLNLVEFMERWRASLAEFERAIGRGLLPAVRHATDAMRLFGAALSKEERK